MATDSSWGAGTRIASLSLFSSLVCYRVLASYAHSILGRTTDADSAVTFAFLLATGLGALVAATRARARSYRNAEIGLAIYCMSFPFLVPWFSDIYLAIAPSITDASWIARNAARFAFTTIAFMVPGFLIGVTVSALARSVDRIGLVVSMTAGAAAGLLASTHLLVPRVGLVGALALATIVKLVLAAVARLVKDARNPAERLTPLAAEPLPWRKILVVAGIGGLVLGSVFFRSVLAFVLQNPIALPSAGAGILAVALLVRRGVELPPFAPLWFAAFASGGLLYTLAAVSPYGASLLLAVALGALISGLDGGASRWIGPSLALAGAGVLVALAAGVGFPIAFLAATALGATFAGAARSTERVGVVYAVSAGGAASGVLAVLVLLLPSHEALGSLQMIGALLLFAGGVTIAMLADIPRRRAVAAIAVSAILWGPLVPIRSAAEEDLVEAPTPSAAATHTAMLFTPERTRALVDHASRDAVAAHGFETILCTATSPSSTSQSTCLREDELSVLSESPSRYDVIIISDSATRELYELASQRLRRLGVLIQDLRIDRLSPTNVFAIINTAHSVFPHVSLWNSDGNAFVLASNEPLLIDIDSVRSEWNDTAFVSGSPLELLSGLVVAGDDMEDFLSSTATLLHQRRDAVSTVNRPASIATAAEELTALQNRAIFERFRSHDPPGFRGAPTREETMLASAALARHSLSALARAWHSSESASLAASTWLYDELDGADASELRTNLGYVAELVATTDTTSSCEPIPRFVSRVARVALSVVDHFGESLDGTEPADAIDGTYDPFVGKGWRARPLARAVTLDVELESPARVSTIYLVVRAVQDNVVVRARLFGRDASGRWYPLASDGDASCEGAHRFELSASSPTLHGVRVEVHGEGALALHELWVEAS